MKNTISVIFLLFFMAALKGQISECPILPSPVVYKKGKGTLYLPKKISIQVLPKGDRGHLPDSSRSQLELLLQTHHSISITDTAGSPFIRFQKLKNVPQDFYSIAVNDQLIISYANEKALYYAFQSLIQLIQTEEVNEVNQMVKQFHQMSKMMKMMQGGKGKQMMQMFQGGR